MNINDPLMNPGIPDSLNSSLIARLTSGALGIRSRSRAESAPSACGAELGGSRRVATSVAKTHRVKNLQALVRALGGFQRGSEQGGEARSIDEPGGDEPGVAEHATRAGLPSPGHLDDLGFTIGYVNVNISGNGILLGARLVFSLVREVDQVKWIAGKRIDLQGHLDS